MPHCTQLAASGTTWASESTSWREPNAHPAVAQADRAAAGELAEIGITSLTPKGSLPDWLQGNTKSPPARWREKRERRFFRQQLRRNLVFMGKPPANLERTQS
jgi:hypothetical protein